MFYLKVSINDKYLFYELNCRRLELIFEGLNIQLRTHWREGRDMDVGPITGWAAVTRECEVVSPIEPEKLKEILKGAEYVPIPEGIASTITEICEINGSKCVRLCDLDIWFRHKAFFRFAWEKVGTKKLIKKLGIDERCFIENCVKNFREIYETFPQQIKEEIQKIERRLLQERLKSQHSKVF
jgi:hypothetical protein